MDRASVTYAIQRLRIDVVHAPPPDTFGGMCGFAGLRVAGKRLRRRTIWVDPRFPEAVWIMVALHEAGHALAPEDGDDHTEILGRSMQRLYRQLLGMDPWVLRLVLHPWWPFVVGPFTLLCAQCVLVAQIAAARWARGRSGEGVPVTPRPRPARARRSRRPTRGGRR